MLEVKDLKRKFIKYNTKHEKEEFFANKFDIANTRDSEN